MPAKSPQVPLDRDAYTDWQGRVDQARAARDTVSPWWDANLVKYAPSPSTSPDTYQDDLNTNRDFTLVERKKADLFYQRPDVLAVPSPLFTGQEALLDTHTALLNEHLGPDGVDAKALAHQVLFDVLCTAGTGWTVMGYESTTVEVEMPDPNQPVPPELAGLVDPPMVTVPVPIFEHCFWDHLSNKQVLIPHDARSTQTDDWSWVGYEFEMSVRVAKRKGWVAETEMGAPTDADLYYDHGVAQGGTDAVVKGVRIFYKSALYRDDIVHPLHQTELIWIEGQEAPAEHRDSPYQTLNPQGGLTPDSLLGYALHPLTIRTLPDSPWVPSDCTISRPLVNELNRFRTQMIEQRDANILRWQYNADVLPQAALEKLVKAPIGGFIGVPGEAYAGDGAIKELPHGTYPRENFSFNDYLDNDLARTHALDSNQQGVLGDSGTTATEAQIQQSNVNARLGMERGIVLDWYLKGVTKYSTLLQRYLSVEDAAAIVGPPAAQAWDTWRHQIPATLAFTAMPDSALRQDTAADRKQAMDLYSFLANDPHVNREELLKKVLRTHHISPEKIVIPEPPAKGPEPAKPSFAFSGADLNPLSPQFAIVMEILRASGYAISPQAVQEAQAGAQNALLAQQIPTQDAGMGAPGVAPHGGKVAQAENLSKHAAALTGNRPGTGTPQPLGPAGGIQ